MMHLSKRRSVALLSVAAAFPLLIAGCSSTDEASSSTPSTSTSTTAAAPAPVNQGLVITIDDFAFEPADATTSVNQLVTWENKDEGQRHTITEDKADVDRIIKSEPLVDGATYSLTFSEAGTYTYICSIHPSRMKGTITVTA